MDWRSTPDSMSFQRSWSRVASTFLFSGDLSGFTTVGEERRCRREGILLTLAVEFRNTSRGWGRDLVLMYFPRWWQSWIELLWSDSCSTLEITWEALSKSFHQWIWREEPCGDSGMPNRTMLNHLSEECLGSEMEDWDVWEECTGGNCEGEDCEEGVWPCDDLMVSFPHYSIPASTLFVDFEDFPNICDTFSNSETSANTVAFSLSISLFWWSRWHSGQ